MPLWRLHGDLTSAVVPLLSASCSCSLLLGCLVIMFAPFLSAPLPLRPAIRVPHPLAQNDELPGGGASSRASAASQPMSSPLAKKSTPSVSARDLSSASTPREAPFFFSGGSSKATSALGRW